MAAEPQRALLGKKRWNSVSGVSEVQWGWQVVVVGPGPIVLISGEVSESLSLVGNFLNYGHYCRQDRMAGERKLALVSPYSPPPQQDSVLHI